MDIFKDVFSKFQNKKNWLFIIGIIGILLIGFSEFLTEKTSNSSEISSTKETDSESIYQKEMEQRLTEIICQVEGAGEVSVMLTLESGPETVYAQNEQNQTQTQQNEDGTVQKQSSYQNEHILFDSGDGKQALVEEQLTPEIRGVAIVCSGGDDIEVIERITELVKVVLDLPSNRICVTKKI
ncbi:stage III sporulation protein AG [uncultured Ruthenibacterium sp.]|uniref:stage III sporulation protein AG n=1 Tax=uncultured Ruthenibacterium sp. TaxID=1905347 RepID=UPI00349E697F